jgi:hypothetical protein
MAEIHFSHHDSREAHRKVPDPIFLIRRHSTSKRHPEMLAYLIVPKAGHSDDIYSTSKRCMVASCWNLHQKKIHSSFTNRVQIYRRFQEPTRLHLSRNQDQRFRKAP